MPLKYEIKTKTQRQELYDTQYHDPRIGRFLYFKQLITVIETIRIGFTPDADGSADSIAGEQRAMKRLDGADSTVVA
jgi:hypothetical protein